MPVILRMIWRTKEDSQVCPICKALEGYTWNIEAGDSLPKKLIHPVFGIVYDTRPVEGSLVNEEEGHLCRCTLLYQIDVSNRLTCELENMSNK